MQHAIDKGTTERGSQHGSTINPLFPSTILPSTLLAYHVTPHPGLGRVGTHLNLNMFMADMDQVEVWRYSRIKNQLGALFQGIRRATAGAGHGHPFPSGRVANGVGRCRVRFPAMLKEEEPIAGTQELDVLDPGQLRQEGEGRVNGRLGSPRQADEAPAESASVAAEKSFERLGEPLPVEGVGNEVAPALRDALEPVDGPHGDAGEDLHDGVVGEVVRRRSCGTPLGVAAALHTADSEVQT